MKKHYGSKIFALLMIASLLLSLLPGLGIIAAAAPAGGPGVISVTKTETAGGTALTNVRTYKEVQFSSSTTLGDKDRVSGHFTCQPVDVEAVKAAPNGIDYYLVSGDDLNKIGTANVQIKNDNIVFTINNFSSSADDNWALDAYSLRSQVKTHQKNPDVILSLIIIIIIPLSDLT